MTYRKIHSLAIKFEKLAGVRAVNYDPKVYKALKEEEKSLDPEDRMTSYYEGLPLSQVYKDTKKFDLKIFDKIKDPTEAGLYAHRRLQRLGQGSSRAAYVYNSKLCLKIAMNPAGVHQNLTEIGISKIGKYNEIIAKVVRHSNDGRWLLSELVIPFEIKDYDDEVDLIASEKEFEDKAKVPFRIMMRGISEGVPEKYHPYFSENQYKFEKMNTEFNTYEDYIKNKPMEEIERKVELAKELINKIGVKASDIWVPYQWGRTADGRIVLLDYGFTSAVHKQHYDKSSPKRWSIEYPEFPIDQSFPTKKY
jgi:hypothetical protein